MAEQLELGTVLADPAVPGNPDAATHFAKYGVGGWQTGRGTIALRDAITRERREWGMVVPMLDGAKWELVKGLHSEDLLDNLNWREMAGGNSYEAIPLAGTAPGKPVTGAIQMAVGTAIYWVLGQLTAMLQVTSVAAGLQLNFSGFARIYLQAAKSAIVGTIYGGQIQFWDESSASQQIQVNRPMWAMFSTQQALDRMAAEGSTAADSIFLTYGVAKTKFAPIGSTGGPGTTYNDAELRARIVALEQQVATLETDLTQAENDINALENEVAAHETRIDALEARPAATPITRDLILSFLEAGDNISITPTNHNTILISATGTTTPTPTGEAILLLDVQGDDAIALTSVQAS
jgi:hypothetical protein